MNQRYSSIFTLAPNLYAVSSPVVIAAGKLLKDNLTNAIVAQLKFRSISNKVIRAVKVKLELCDTAGNSLGKTVVYDYLDLYISRSDVFGQRDPVPIPDIRTRCYTIAVTEVIFDDRTVWTAPDEPWESLGVSRLLNISDPELLKQYRLVFGSKSKYEPMEEKNLWLCTCGQLNHAGESCRRCKNTLHALLTVNMAALEAEKNARLEREAQKAAAERAAAEMRRLKNQKILKIAFASVCTTAAVVALVIFLLIPTMKDREEEKRLEVAYAEAVVLADAGLYEEAIAIFEPWLNAEESQDLHLEYIFRLADHMVAEGKYLEATQILYPLADHTDSQDQYLEYIYSLADQLVTEEKYQNAVQVFHQIIDYKDCRDRYYDLWKNISVTDSPLNLSASNLHTVGLKADGTVMAAGYSKDGRCDVSGWQDIVSISAGTDHTVGLKLDGTVVATGINKHNRCRVSNWQDIVAVSAGAYHTVGLKSDGTVIAVGLNTGGQCDVSAWQDIVAISASGHHTVGLKADGTVVAVGLNKNGQCGVNNWQDIVAVSAGAYHTVGLKSDGTVIAVGLNKDGQCDVSAWQDIVAISASEHHTVGLKADGTVVAVGLNKDGQCDVRDWQDIVAISAGSYHTTALKTDGTVIAVGLNEDGQCDVFGWTNMKLPD